MATRAHPSPLSPDEQLVRRFQETGDSECFAELFARHRKKVFLACRGFFRDVGTAEDATQETFLRVYQNMHRFHAGDFSRWVMHIARNVCIDLWRKHYPEWRSDDLHLIEGKMADVSSDLYLTVQRVQQEMQSLFPEQRRCLEMKIEGYSYEETAARTGLSVEAVKSHLQNGRRMLWLKMGNMLSQTR